MRMLVFSLICAFFILGFVTFGVTPVRAGWLTGWMPGQKTSTALSDTVPVTSEFYSPPSQYGGPRPVVVTAPGVWDKTRTPADIAAQLRVINDRNQAQSGLKDSILRNRIEAERAADRARNNTVTLAPAPGMIASPIAPTAPIAPVSPLLPRVPSQQTMPFGGGDRGRAVQAILPHLGGGRPAPAASVSNAGGEGQQGIQPILPILRAAPPPAPARKE